MSTSEPNQPSPAAASLREGADRPKPASCTVNSSFNYSVGAVSVAVGIALIWFGWRYLGV